MYDFFPSLKIEIPGRLWAIVMTYYCKTMKNFIKTEIIDAVKECNFDIEAE